jgi:nucleotide-binding universal stress UspA family protein
MRVLVATDLSKAADEAIKQAAELAGSSGTLAAVHVLPSLQSVSMLFPQKHAEEVVDLGAVISRVSETLRERITQVAAHDADIFVEQGSDYAEIVRRAEVWKAEIVVVGSHGHTGLSRVFGGVAERVVRYAHCRVLIARETPKRGIVLVATDLSDPSLPAVTAAAEEAARRGVALKVIHAVDFVDMETRHLFGLGTPATYDVTNLRDPARDQLADVMKRNHLKAETQILSGSASAAIVGEAEKSGAELLVLGSHGRTGLTRLLLGSVAEKVVRTSSCSVLVVRMPS